MAGECESRNSHGTPRVVHHMPARLACPIGKRFGNLEVIGDGGYRVTSSGVRRHRWSLRCDCNAVVTHYVSAVNTGKLVSCRACANKRRERHGHAKLRQQPPEYFVWTGMRRRCNYPKDRSYARYGGRGIAVCARWDDFAFFLSDMGQRPSPRHQIDRIDNDGNYEPSNCRWVLPRENTRNRRSNRLVTHDNKTMPLSEWAEATGVNAPCLTARIDQGHRLGVVLETPVQKRGTVLDAARDRRKLAPTRSAVLVALSDGPKPWEELAKHTGLSRHALRGALTRLKRDGLVSNASRGTWSRCG